MPAAQTRLTRSVVGRIRYLLIAGSRDEADVALGRREARSGLVWPEGEITDC